MRDLVLVAGFLRNLVLVAERGERALCALSAAAFTTLIVANVVLRYVFGKPLYFAEELSTILMIWMALLASSITLGRRQMVAVTFAIDALPEKLRRMAQFLAEIFVFTISVIFTYWSSIWISSPAASRDIIITLDIEKWYSYLIVPIFFFMSSLKSLNNIFHVAGQVER